MLTTHKLTDRALVTVINLFGREILKSYVLIHKNKVYSKFTPQLNFYILSFCKI